MAVDGGGGEEGCCVEATRAGGGRGEGREMAKNPTLVDVCWEMEGVEQVAFLYRERAVDGGMFPSFYRRLGLQDLWPENMPSLRVIYLVDIAIKPKAGGKPPLPGTAFAGHEGTFYPVTADDTDVWDIALPAGGMMPVFGEATSLQLEYTPRIWGVPVLRVKVLAFVAH